MRRLLIIKEIRPKMKCEKCGNMDATIKVLFRDNQTKVRHRLCEKCTDELFTGMVKENHQEMVKRNKGAKKNAK